MQDTEQAADDIKTENVDGKPLSAFHERREPTLYSLHIRRRRQHAVWMCFIRQTLTITTSPLPARPRSASCSIFHDRPCRFQQYCASCRDPLRYGVRRRFRAQSAVVGAIRCARLASTARASAVTALYLNRIPSMQGWCFASTSMCGCHRTPILPINCANILHVISTGSSKYNLGYEDRTSHGQRFCIQPICRLVAY